MLLILLYYFGDQKRGKLQARNTDATQKKKIETRQKVKYSEELQKHQETILTTHYHNKFEIQKDQNKIHTTR